MVCECAGIMTDGDGDGEVLAASVELRAVTADSPPFRPPVLCITAQGHSQIVVAFSLVLILRKTGGILHLSLPCTSISFSHSLHATGLSNPAGPRPDRHDTHNLKSKPPATPPRPAEMEEIDEDVTAQALPILDGTGHDDGPSTPRTDTVTTTSASPPAADTPPSPEHHSKKESGSSIENHAKGLPRRDNEVSGVLRQCPPSHVLSLLSLIPKPTYTQKDAGHAGVP